MCSSLQSCKLPSNESNEIRHDEFRQEKETYAPTNNNSMSELPEGMNDGAGTTGHSSEVFAGMGSLAGSPTL